MSFAGDSIDNSKLEEEIVRCIQIGLLCVQEFPDDRPTIQTVVSMLSREIVELPPPTQPVFADKWNGFTTHPANQVGYSINELTLSVLHGRWFLYTHTLPISIVSNNIVLLHTFQLKIDWWNFYSIMIWKIEDYARVNMDFSK